MVENPEKSPYKHWTYIESDLTLTKLFPEQPMIAYRRSKNIKEFVSKARLPTDSNHHPTGMEQHYSQQITSSISTCGHPQCGTCKMLRKRPEISSSITKETYPITDKMTCATLRFIYLIECEKCNDTLTSPCGKE